MPKGMQPIYSRTITSNTGSIIFNNIPQTFKDLKVIISGRAVSNNAGTIYVRFNESSVGYNAIIAYGETTGSGSFTLLNADYGHVGYLTAGIDANSCGAVEMYIANYKERRITNIISNSTTEANAITYQSGIQNHNALIATGHTSIVNMRIASSETIAANTTIYLYGIGD